VNDPELIIGILLVAALLGLGGYFAWRQFQIRRTVAQDRAMPSQERGYLILQTRRRLVCSVLMILFAGLLIGWYFIESNLPDLKLAAEQEPAKTHPLLELLTLYWIIALLVLFGILTLAGMDFFATARYAMHQKRLLDSERRATLQAETDRLRNQRNGS
jgi:hypothetical protein